MENTVITGKGKYTQEQFIQAVKESRNCSEVCRKLGIVGRGGNLRTVKRNIYLLNLDTSHFTGQAWNKGLTFMEHPSISSKDIKDMLVENSLCGSYFLKNRLLKEGLKEHVCECCKNSEWMGKPIPLQLHHINGNHTDNRIENLQLLCPNCHALTDNYCSKNRSKNDVIYIRRRTSTTLPLNSYSSESTIKEKVTEKRICPVCGNEFVIKGKKQKGQKYCSYECSHMAAIKTKEPLTIDLIVSAFKDYKSFLGMSKYFGISDKAIAKHCKRLGIPHTRKELEEFVNNYPQQ